MRVAFRGDYAVNLHREFIDTFIIEHPSVSRAKSIPRVHTPPRRVVSLRDKRIGSAIHLVDGQAR